MEIEYRPKSLSYTLVVRFRKLWLEFPLKIALTPTLAGSDIVNASGWSLRRLFSINVHIMTFSQIFAVEVC